MHRSVVPFKTQYLKSPLSGRVFFLGDAARAFAPLGMTSMNLGIQEADKIAAALENGIEDNLPMSHFNSLGEDMIEQWKVLSNLKEHSIPDTSTDPWVTENRAAILEALPVTGNALEKLASQLSIDLRLNHLVPA